MKCDGCKKDITIGGYVDPMDAIFPKSFCGKCLKKHIVNKERGNYYSNHWEVKIKE